MRGATTATARRAALRNFNPRSSCEERLKASAIGAVTLRFQSTLLMRGATPCRPCCPPSQSYFNPRSSCEERLRLMDDFIIIGRFQSTLLMRGATGCPAAGIVHVQNFNPRSSCEERHDASIGKFLSAISIHAPHARSDTSYRRLIYLQVISIHAPHARSDKKSWPLHQLSPISIHAPHARSDRRASSGWCAASSISIHAPHARSDVQPDRPWRNASNFNPRSSCEERLSVFVWLSQVCTISIHAPHARSDSRSTRYQTRWTYFNPRSSCEERHGVWRDFVPGERNFNPRSSCEERRRYSVAGRHCENISIHAPHARSDPAARKRVEQTEAFQSTLLMRGATGAGLTQKEGA